MNTCAELASALLIFARAPVPGAAKTRMIELLGASGAAHLHERLTEQTLATSMRAKIGPVQLWCTPSCTHPFFSGCALRYPIELRRQSGPTLGARMGFAFQCELPRHDAVVLIGTDCPALTAAHLQAAAADLKHHDAVIFPAEDGGYVLLGLAQPCPEVFTHVNWGSDQVFAQTMAQFAAAGMHVAVRDTLWDVDVPADFQRLTSTFGGWADLAP